MARQLTEKQQKFLDVLFDQAGGNVVEAKKLAGYSENNSTTEIVKSLKEEIVEITQLYMARNAPVAAMSLVDGMVDPTQLGLRDKLVAAKDLLDRVGLAKTEKLQVEASNGLMILPPKDIALPSIVILEFANLAFAIDPPNIALVIPLALTCKVPSSSNPRLLSSTLTLKTLLEADNPSPANKVAKSVNDSFAAVPFAPPSKNKI